MGRLIYIAWRQRAVIPLYHSPSSRHRDNSRYLNGPEVRIMGTARVFRSGNSQAVRLPKDLRFKSKEVEIFRRGDEIILREKAGTMERAFDLLAGLPDDSDSLIEAMILRRNAIDSDGTSLSAGTNICVYIGSAGRRSLAPGSEAESPARLCPQNTAFPLALVYNDRYFQHSSSSYSGGFS